MKVLGCLLLLLPGVIIGHAGQPETSFTLESVGARIGLSAFNSGPEFHQVDATAVANLPWKFDLEKACTMQSVANMAFGWLGDPGHDAFVTSAGPGLMFAHGDFPFKLEGGLAPTFISRADFGSKDLGTRFQFTSHIGLLMDMGPRLRVSYRFQHMSNGGFAYPNPGLNLHMIGVSYHF